MTPALPLTRRVAASPLARRLAVARAVALGDVAGSGPGGRIVAADILAHRGVPAPQPPVSFSAALSLSDLCAVLTAADRAGRVIGIEDVALRAARIALAALPGAIALEGEGRQIITAATPGLSIAADRQARMAALSAGQDAATSGAAVASLLVIAAARVVPVTLPPLPPCAVRLVLTHDRDRGQGHALIAARPDALTPAQAADALGAFVAALERPFALLA